MFSFLSLSSLTVPADTYWVSPGGGAVNWAAALSPTVLAPENCATLDQMNKNVNDGDTVNLRAGDYNGAIILFNKNAGSETESDRITIQAYDTEQVTIKNQTDIADSLLQGFRIVGSDYVTIRNIDIQSQDLAGGATGNQPIRVSTSDYFELDSCDIQGSGKNYPGHANWVFIDRSTHGWIHDCTIYELGYVTSRGRDSNAINIGNGTPACSNWTIENNILHSGSHHVLTINVELSVIRNNQFWNESWMPDTFGNASREPDINGLYGNRCLSINRVKATPNDDQFILCEGNRIGKTGVAPDDAGDANLALTGCNFVIVRYNEMYNGIMSGLYIKNAGGAVPTNKLRIYNNTVWDTGNIPDNGDSWGAWDAPLWRDMGTGTHDDYVLKNNVFDEGRGYAAYSISDAGGKISFLDGGSISGCFLGPTSDGGLKYDFDAGDPLFINPLLGTVESSTVPNLRLQADSPLIDAGVALTTASGSGAASSTLVVVDAKYFQDGSWGSALASLNADWIAVGSTTNVVEIESIDYTTNTINLATPLTWADDNPVYLYKKSDGVRVLFDAAPDQGAHESSAGGDWSFTVVAPLNLKLASEPE